MGAVYNISCLPNDKFYIGSSKNPSARWKSHRDRLNKGSHENCRLQKAWEVYGYEGFRFVVVEEVSDNMLLEREQWWIDNTNCCDPSIGFNMCPIVNFPISNIVKDRVANNEQHLLSMAANGEPKPSFRNHPLGQIFYNYTASHSYSFNPIFTDKIRGIAPHWFIKIGERYKDELLDLAKSGDSRPIAHKHALGRHLNDYTRKTCHRYDSDFDATIRRLRPDWF